jgi:hypothetical protein
VSDSEPAAPPWQESLAWVLSCLSVVGVEDGHLRAAFVRRLTDPAAPFVLADRNRLVRLVDHDHICGDLLDANERLGSALTAERGVRGVVSTRTEWGVGPTGLHPVLFETKGLAESFVARHSGQSAVASRVVETWTDIHGATVCRRSPWMAQ